MIATSREATEVIQAITVPSEEEIPIMDESPKVLP
jgi:hypothetical protein